LSKNKFIRMTRKHAFFCVLAGIQLFLVACGAAELPLLPTDDRGGKPTEEEVEEVRWGKVLRMVRECSGSEVNHGYFSPGVGQTHRMIFVLKDEAGRTWTDKFEKTGIHEADLRLAGIVDAMLPDDEDDPEQIKLLDQYAKSCGAKMLARHATAVLVTIRVEGDQMPTMAEYRAGARVTWEKVYETTLARSDVEDQDQDQGQDEE
jgi:hypothetical protein